MKVTGPAKSLVLGAALLSATMLVSLLSFTPTAEAAAFSGPCPSYSIQNVFDDPNGNWDNDQMRNADELYNGLNPCLVDTDTFCAAGGNSLCIYYTYVYTSHTYPTACQNSINAFPNGDYDGDGISNTVEIRNGANPCTHPCPNPTGTDLALNPNGSWDNDGISNAVEVSQGTNPCSGLVVNPCPYYTQYQVDLAPGYDWDGDGVSNRTELYRGTNPCVYNAVVNPHVVIRPTQRLPHVTIVQRPVYTPPPVYSVPVRPVCPRGYPYYHSGNGLCYANPVGLRWS